MPAESIMMMKGRILFLLLAIMLLLPSVVSATNIYIDPDCIHNGDGTFNSGSCATGAGQQGPYNTWTGITFSASDDYCQKCGTSWAGSITITTSGTSENYMILGAYYDNGGSPVHEWDNPSFGEFCGNAVAKPIIAKSDNTGSAILIETGVQYVQVDSLQLEKGEQNVGLKGGGNRILYCRLMDGNSAIRVGLVSDSNYNYIGYNYCYTDVGAAPSLDGIRIGPYADHNTIEYNVIDGFSHAGIFSDQVSEYNEMMYNSIYSHDQVLDHCMEPKGYYTKCHHNYCYDSGDIQVMSGDHISVYNNIVYGSTSNPYLSTGHGALIHISHGNDLSTVDSTFSNNVYYDRRDGFPNPTGILVLARNNGGVVERNLIANNIVLNLDSTYQPFRVNDGYNSIDSTDGPNGNIWKNNIACPNGTCASDGYTGTYYAHIEGTNYATASAFNARGSNYDSNRDDDPGLFNPANSEFWPDDPTDSVVGNGLDLGSDYDQIFDPDGTDLTIHPMTVSLTTQSADSWYIGAFAMSGTCIEDWNCTDWSCSPCVDGQQDCTRTCTDDNECGTENNKPPETETQVCVQYFLPEEYIEAESGSLGLPMIIGTDAGASGGSYVHTTVWYDGSVNFIFDIHDAGDYRLEASVLTPQSYTAHDSFYIGLDGEDAQGDDNYTYDTHHSDVFAWDNVSLRGPSGNHTHAEFNPMVWELSVGLHTFTFYGREPDTRLDQIILKKVCHRADEDCNGCIEEHELIPFIYLWRYDSTEYPMMEVMEAVTMYYNPGDWCS